MAKTTQPLKLGIAGLGTVGISTVELLTTHAETIRVAAGREILITAVNARDKNRKRSFDITGFRWVDDPLALASDAEVDVVVELIGGADGIAYDLVKQTLQNGKSVVTANKALIARHGAELATLAEDNHVSLAFEAAVAAAIPVLKTIRQGLSANHISRVIGILNGTCNYILSKMQEEKRNFADILAEAQTLGYAEADPSFDVDGIDTAHKLAILTSLAFGSAPDLASVSTEGIRDITLDDIEYANELGYTIKLLGITEQTDEGILQRVHPCMVAKETALANVSGVFNAIYIESDNAGPLFLEGQGAGGMPTASAVVADIIDVAGDNAGLAFGRSAKDVTEPNALSLSQLHSSYYLRFNVLDRPGVLADMTAVFREADISVKSFLQQGEAPDEMVHIVVVTHPTTEAHMQKALQIIAAQTGVKEPPLSIRIEEL